MRLSKRSEYGVRAAIQLAATYGSGYVQTQEISRRERLPNKFLEAILRSMKSAGLLVSKIGASGGYRLAEPPESISLLRLLEALEGELISKELVTPPKLTAALPAGRVAVHLLARRLHEAMHNATESTTLAELLEQANQAQSRNRQMYYI